MSTGPERKDLYDMALIAAVTIVAKYGRLCTATITIQSLTDGSSKLPPPARESSARRHNENSVVSCQTLRNACDSRAWSSHLGVRKNGFPFVTSPDSTAFATAWVSDNPAMEAMRAPFSPEPTF